MTDHAVGDLIVYRGSLGEYKGAVVDVRHLFDENGTQLTGYVVALDGVGNVLTSGDALSPAVTAVPPGIEILRESYADTSVPPPVEQQEPSAFAAGGPITPGAAVVVDPGPSPALTPEQHAALAGDQEASDG